MKGKIGFDELQISCIIGCHDEERIAPRLVFVDLRVEAEFPTSDQIEDAVNYHELATLCQKLSENHYHLLETFAQAALTEIFARYPVSWGWIRLSKPKALGDTRATVVELEHVR